MSVTALPNSSVSFKVTKHFDSEGFGLLGGLVGRVRDNKGPVYSISVGAIVNVGGGVYKCKNRRCLKCLEEYRRRGIQCRRLLHLQLMVAARCVDAFKNQDGLVD
jgi:hypothetical protein